MADAVDPLIESSARIIHRAAADIDGHPGADWAAAAAGVVMCQPVIAGSFHKATQYDLMRVRILNLHQVRSWGAVEPDIFGKPIPETRQCRECGKSYPCDTVRALGVNE